jgi:membrane-bound metal-dependent hydrolase YbcI (DUF457 family)
MIAGHFFLAFSAVALFAYLRNYEPDKALKIGLMAGAFAVLPDVDMIYAFKELSQLTSGFHSFSDSFWSASTETHRGATHSLVTLFLTAAAMIGYYRYDSKLFAGLIVAGSFSAVFFLEGIYMSFLISLFTASALLLTHFSREKFEMKEFVGAMFFGLLSHPFGDVFTGTPPDFLYPLPIEVLQGKVVLLQDPSLNFLAVFGLELFLIWTGIAVYIYLAERSLMEEFSFLSVTGVLYGALSFFISDPSLSRPYTFVFSILVFSALVTAVIWFFTSRDRKYFYAVLDFLGVLLFGYLSYLTLLLIF